MDGAGEALSHRERVTQGAGSGEVVFSARVLTEVIKQKEEGQGENHCSPRRKLLVSIKEKSWSLGHPEEAGLSLNELFSCAPGF